MLLSLLKSLTRGAGRDAPAAAAEGPAERYARIKHAHSRAPLAHHMDILFRNMNIGGLGLTGLVERCISESRASSHVVKTLHRPLASYFLARYFLHALDLGAAQAECGVLAGTSALLLCRAAQTRDAAYAGAGLHLIDSFEGLDDPTAEDHFPLSSADGSGSVDYALPRGWLSAPVEHAKKTLREFPRAQFHKGWIPEVFAGLPAVRWSFVHLDLDHYAPTLASLEYFYPRLVPGGVILCDDYGAPFFPGAHRAWNEFCDARAISYVVLDTGQSVMLKPASAPATP